MWFSTPKLQENTAFACQRLPSEAVLGVAIKCATSLQLPHFHRRSLHPPSVPVPIHPPTPPHPHPPRYFDRPSITVNVPSRSVTPGHLTGWSLRSLGLKGRAESSDSTLFFFFFFVIYIQWLCLMSVRLQSKPFPDLSVVILKSLAKGHMKGRLGLILPNLTT